MESSTTTQQLINPLIEESTINPTTHLPSFLELLLVDASIISAQSALRSTLDVLFAHHHRSSPSTSTTNSSSSFRQRVLEYSSQTCQSSKAELCMVVTYWLERYRLRSKSQSSVGESFYSLMRSKVTSVVEEDENGGSSSLDARNPRLSLDAMREVDIIRSALVLSIGPYVREKMEDYFRRERERDPTTTTTGTSMEWWFERLRRVYLTIYPYLHMTMDGLQLSYNLSYLMGRSIYYNPSLHALGLVVRRVTMADLEDEPKLTHPSQSLGVDNTETASSSAPSSSSSIPSSHAMGNVLRTDEEGKKRMARALAIGVLSIFAAGWLGTLHSILRQSRRRWITVDDASFARDEEEDNQRRDQGQLGIPPPVTPRLLSSLPVTTTTTTNHDQDHSPNNDNNNNNHNQTKTKPKTTTKLPEDPSLCPLCCEKRLHPVASTSGYVFCYRCMCMYIRENGERCPLTGMRCKESQLVRIYESTETVPTDTTYG